MEADPKVMHSEARSQLVQRLLAPDRLDRHPRLELGAVLFPRGEMTGLARLQELDSSSHGKL